MSSPLSCLIAILLLTLSGAQPRVVWGKRGGEDAKRLKGKAVAFARSPPDFASRQDPSQMEARFGSSRSLASQTNGASTTAATAAVSTRAPVLAETTEDPSPGEDKSPVSTPAEGPMEKKQVSSSDEDESLPDSSHENSGTAAAISSDKKKYSAADADEYGYITVIVTFDNPAGKYDDWIGIYPADAEDVAAGTIPHPSVDWQYVCRTQVDCDEDGSVVESGNVEFAGLPPGTYRAFLAANTDAPYPVIAASEPFEVEGTFFQGDEPIGEALNWTDDWTDDLMGDWDIGVNSTLASISTDKSTYSVDDHAVIITFDNPGANSDDWVGIYPLGSAFEGNEGLIFLPSGSSEWMYLCGGKHCSGVVTSGSVTFTNALGPGVYQACLVLNTTAPYPAIAASDPFEITQGTSAGPLVPENNSPAENPSKTGTDDSTPFLTWTSGEGIRSPRRAITFVLAVTVLASVSIYFCCRYGSSRSEESGSQYGRVAQGTFT